MCGRFMMTAPPDVLIAAFDLAQDSFVRAGLETLRPRYNIAPGQQLLALRVEQATQQREPVLLHWGLIPSWAEDKKVAYRMINARCETVTSKAAFRAAFKQRRCLIPATGFYEWQQHGKTKQPFCIRLNGDEVFAFAGLWESWRDANGTTLESCSIITTTANTLMQDIHERMPVILTRADYGSWLDGGFADAEYLQSLLRPYAAEAMYAYEVSSRVNKVTYDDSSCAQAATRGQIALL